MSAGSDFSRYYLREAGVCPPLAGRRLSADTAMAGEPGPDDGPSSDLGELAAGVRGCTACDLAASRTQTVFGVGNPDAQLMFVGEAPGRDEDLKGEPFVGPAGQLLDRMLAAMGLDRSQVYIMNVVKCRPPHNRNPEAGEIAACAPWFEAQWRAVSPRVVCLLGKVAAGAVLGREASVSSLRGRWHEGRGAKLRVTYHPAYLLRSPQQKGKVWADMQAIMRALKVDG